MNAIPKAALKSFRRNATPMAAINMFMTVSRIIRVEVPTARDSLLLSLSITQTRNHNNCDYYTHCYDTALLPKLELSWNLRGRIS